MALKWWEKTVEYYFIKRCVGDRMVIAPLDGREESAGDAIFSTSNRWILIEFKKDHSCIESELTKFFDYSLAKSELSDRDNHHHIIYGSISPDTLSPKFELIAVTYFSNQQSESVEQIIESGVGLQEFVDYLRKFTAHKKSGSSSSSGGVSPEEYSLVAGIGEDNNIIGCMTLSEFGLECGLSFTPNHVQSATNFCRPGGLR